jgi:hypothetical protein
MRETSEGQRPWLVRAVCFAALRAADRYPAPDRTLEERGYRQLPVGALMGLSCRVADAWRKPMNTFYAHHRDSIRFGYRCFDRILLNGLIHPFQQPERVVGFFNTYRELYPLSTPVLKDIARQYEHWVTARAKEWAVSVVEPPAHQRRDDFVDRYFRRTTPDQVVVILKAREPARVRVCPYFPFSARVCLKQHHWLAHRLSAAGVAFRQCGNAFVTCSDPTRLQALADALTPRDLARCAQKWLRTFTPFFTPTASISGSSPTLTPCSRPSA